jgi:SWI/SNF-related matrix-associated actin-dependent regulator 1 of chromatin subfamily A
MTKKPKIKLPPKSKPLVFQKKGVRKIDRFKGRALLADEMGLGKTFQAIWWNYWRNPDQVLIVVCPASLKLNWKKECWTHFRMRSEIINGRKIPKWFQFKKDRPVKIINYQILKEWVPALKALGPVCVIVDESHNIKNRRTQSFSNVRKLAKKIKHRIVISGTPLTNRPAELWTSLYIANPKLFPHFIPFAFQFCAPKRTRWGWDYSGARNLDKLHNILKTNVMIRRLKKNVLKQLPDKVRRVIPLTLDPADMKEYEKANNTFIRWLAAISKTKARRASKNKALVQIGYLTRLAANLKMKLVLDWIDNFLASTDEKLVVMGWHQKILDQICERYNPSLWVRVSGNVVKMTDRHAAVNKFQKNPKVRLFVGNIKAAGTGLTLTSSASCVFVECPFTPGDLIQAEDRIHRIGQKKKCMIYYLVAADTIEPKICNIIQRKQKILSSALDGGSKEEDIDIYDQLLKALKK